MATTKIWPVYGTFNLTIDYAGNIEKTTASITTYDGNDMPVNSIDNVIKYTTRDEATGTEEGRYVSTLNCSYEYAYEEFLLVKEKYAKTDKILVHHGYQSFKPGEVTPEEAHMIGVELAKILWGDRFQVVVTTHLDKAHLHNHFVVNSVSYIDGMKFKANRETYFRMRQESDELCRMYGKSVIEEPKYNGITRGVYRAEKEGRYSYRNIVFADIDRFIQDSSSMEEFLQKVNKAGYTLNNDRMYLRIMAPGHQTVRLDRKDENYSLEAIAQRISENGKKNKGNRVKTYYSQGKTPKPDFKYKGYKALYVKLMYELGEIPEKRYKYNHILIREELINAGKLGNEMRFLIKNNISTSSDLDKCSNRIQNIYDEYNAERKRLRNQLRRAKGKEKADELREKITKCNKVMANCRKEMFYCKDIKERSGKINNKLIYNYNLKDKYKNQERGGINYEWSK